MTPDPSGAALPCPWCNHPGHIDRSEPDSMLSWYARCGNDDCIATILTPLRQSRSEAIADWNRRPTPQADDAVGGWVACSERMPADGADVMVYHARTGFIYVSNWDAEQDLWTGHSLGMRCPVTHWQPLPLPPAKDATV